MDSTVESHTPSGEVSLRQFEREILKAWGEYGRTDIVGHYVEPVDVRLDVLKIEASEVPVRRGLIFCTCE